MSGKNLSQYAGINTRKRNKGSQAENNQRQDRKQQALFQIRRLAEDDASIFAAIFSANDTIFISLKLLLVSRIGEKNPSPSLFELNT